MTSPPDIDDLVARAHVVALPLRVRFRGILEREALLLDGPAGWAEFSPFPEYDDGEAAVWLAAALEAGWHDLGRAAVSAVRVNATVPAVAPEEVASILARFPGCRTVKVKVAERGQAREDDLARVREVRNLIGDDGRIRVDANGSWTVEEAETALRMLAPYRLEYAEQPCASVPELAALRSRISDLRLLIAADESVRRAADPVAVARAGAADVLVIKAQPLGGLRRAREIVAEAGLPVVVSSALDTSIGLALGARLAAGLPDGGFDHGLGTAALLAADVVSAPLHPVNGTISTARPAADRGLLQRHAASRDRREWWLERLRRCHALLAG